MMCIWIIQRSVTEAEPAGDRQTFEVFVVPSGLSMSIKLDHGQKPLCKSLHLFLVLLWVKESRVTSGSKCVSHRCSIFNICVNQPFFHEDIRLKYRFTLSVIPFITKWRGPSGLTSDLSCLQEERRPSSHWNNRLNLTKRETRAANAAEKLDSKEAIWPLMMSTGCRFQLIYSPPVFLNTSKPCNKIKLIKLLIGAPQLLILSKKNPWGNHYICPPETVSFVHLWEGLEKRALSFLFF